MDVKQRQTCITMILVLLTQIWIVADANQITHHHNSKAVKALFVLGDSLLDVGNNIYLPQSELKRNYYPYGIDFPNRKPTGRFSNGKNSADFMAEMLGLGNLSPPPYFSMNGIHSLKDFTGVNFASGGAGILNHTINGGPSQCIPLSYQVQYFKKIRRNLIHKLGKKHTEKFLAKKSIFLFSVGSNDLTSYSTNQSFPEFLNLLISSLQTQLQQIYDAGARKIVYLGIGQLGCVPDLRLNTKNGDCFEQANNMALAFNKELNSLLVNMSKSLPGFKYALADTYSLFAQYIHNYKSFGFKDAADACCGGGRLNAALSCLPNSTFCPNRAEYLFWDSFHSTQRLTGLMIGKLFNGTSSVIQPLNVADLVASP